MAYISIESKKLIRTIEKIVENIEFLNGNGDLISSQTGRFKELLVSSFSKYDLFRQGCRFAEVDSAPYDRRVQKALQSLSDKGLIKLADYQFTS